MSLGRARAVALVGLEGHLVEVEADVASGLPAFVLVGLPDASLGEARDRVRAAFGNAGVPLPARRLTVNLSPASLPKRGTGFDLAVAVALLAATGAVPRASAAAAVHLGELGLDGRVRPVHGVLPAVLAAARAGVQRVVVPAGDRAEAALVPGVEVVPVASLREVVLAHGGDAGALPVLPPAPGEGARPASGGAPGLRRALPGGAAGDLAEVVGQVEARRAVEVAAAGGHHLLLLGPPGAGKTMLAARLPGLLPDLDPDDALEVTAVHSVSGAFDPEVGLLRRPPLEDPHHTATAAAVLGGGTALPRPGAASRAHRGVLLLDEAPEFSTRVLEGLRQPLESGHLVIARASGQARYPARFQLVLTANPCPCGMASGKGLACSCTSLARRRYLGRLSGPLLDRVDLRVHVRPVTVAEVASAAPRETTAAVAARVLAARAAARQRWAGTGAATNAEVPGALLRGPFRLPARATAELERAMRRGSMTMRGHDRSLRLAWTLADLGGAALPDADHVSEAVLHRQDGREAA